MSCTQEWTESWLLREVDGHQSLRPPTHWRLHLPAHPTTEGPVPSRLPGAWVWVQTDEKRRTFPRVVCLDSTSRVSSAPLQMLPTSPPSHSSQQERWQRGGPSPWPAALMQLHLQGALRGLKVWSSFSAETQAQHQQTHVLFYLRAIWTVSLHVSLSALQIWTVAASQTASALSSTCPISNTPTGESTSV